MKSLEKDLIYEIFPHNLYVLFQDFFSYYFEALMILISRYVNLLKLSV